MKVAVVSTASQYSNLQDLPGCSRDQKAIEELIRATRKYDDVHVLPENAPSSQVKAELTKLVTEHKGKSVDEVFFYYSGHGALHKDEFRFLLSDYDPGARNKTSLGNNELDTMVRSLGPRIFIKVIDACHAGSRYIKDADALKSYWKGTENAFETCYFFLSSLQEQSSYQDIHLSDFTRSVIGSVAKRIDGPVRLQDMIASITDDFEDNDDQTPFFITQGSFTEVFCTVDDAVRSALTPFLSDQGKAAAASPAGASPSKPTLLEKVQKDALLVAESEDVESVLNALREALNEAKVPEDLSALYDVENAYDATDMTSPDLAAIGRWLSKDSSGSGYFAEVQYAREPYEAIVQVPREPNAFERAWQMSAVFGGGLTEPKTVTKHRKVISGFESTASLPYFGVRMTACPRFGNLGKYELYATFLASRRDLAMFYCAHQLRETTWGKYEAPDDPSWKRMVSRIKNESVVDDLVTVLCDWLWSKVSADVFARFGDAGDSDAP